MNELIALFGFLGFIGATVAVVALWTQRQHDNAIDSAQRCSEAAQTVIPQATKR